MIVTSCRVYLSGTLRDIARAAAGLCRDVGQAAPVHRQPPRRAGPRAVLLPSLPVQPGGLPEGLRGWPVLPMPAPVEQRQSRSRTSPCPTRLQTIWPKLGVGIICNYLRLICNYPFPKQHKPYTDHPVPSKAACACVGPACSGLVRRLGEVCLASPSQKGGGPTLLIHSRRQNIINVVGSGS